ncbi:MAG: hypothetical protein ACSLEN_00455 [Candidatus Malihini olakiniferum]
MMVNLVMNGKTYSLRPKSSGIIVRFGIPLTSFMTTLHRLN